jgi:hypothetical protein
MTARTVESLHCAAETPRLKEFLEEFISIGSVLDSNDLEGSSMNVRMHMNWIGKGRARLFAMTTAAVLTVVCLGGSAYSPQAVHSTGQRFAGTWKADHEGSTILLLEFRPERGTLSGTIRLMDFQMDLQGTGAVRQLRGGPLSEPIPLVKLKIDGDHLLFEFKEDDDQDSTHWRMDLIDADRAALQWIELPPGFKAQPFHLSKETEGHSKGSN